MTRRPTVQLLALAALGVSSVVVHLSAREGGSQGADAVQKVAERTDKTLGNERTYMGPDTCIRCHTNGLGTVSSDPAIAALFPATGLVNDSWCLLDEVKTWATADKHSQAYTSLLNARSKRMGEIMGVKEIHRDRRCLACHTAYPVDDMPLDLQPGAEDSVEVLVAESISEDRKLTLGVTCEGCHGFAGDSQDGKKKGWYVAHATKEPWRFEEMKTKQDRNGFFDVRSSAAKAANCLSCHLGDAREGRVVTHEMYAAGHPPLPGFELRSFLNQMPKHWREFHEKGDSVRNEFVKRTKLDYDDADLHETKDLLIGSVVAVRENYRLSLDLAEMSRSEASLGGLPAKAEWPELSQFDCFACHHDLKDQGWRQERRGGVPGRPLLREWPSLLADVALEVVGEPRLSEHAKAVDATLADQPFGDTETFIATTRKTVGDLDAAVRVLEGTKFTKSVGEKVLRVLADRAVNGFYDYDSARNLLWAFQHVRAEALPEPSPQIEGELEKLSAMFVMDLKAGRTVQQRLPGAVQGREVQEVDLTKTLPPIADFDPAKFRASFKVIAEALPAAK